MTGENLLYAILVLRYSLLTLGRASAVLPGWCAALCCSMQRCLRKNYELTETIELNEHHQRFKACANRRVAYVSTGDTETV